MAKNVMRQGSALSLLQTKIELMQKITEKLYRRCTATSPPQKKIQIPTKKPWAAPFGAAQIF